MRDLAPNVEYQIVLSSGEAYVVALDSRWGISAPDISSTSTRIWFRPGRSLYERCALKRPEQCLMAGDGRNASRGAVCSVSKRHLQGKPFQLGRGGTGVLEVVPVAARKLPIEDQVLKLLGDGLDKEVAKKVGITANRV
jgi:hypothetical protein